MASFFQEPDDERGEMSHTIVASSHSFSLCVLSRDIQSMYVQHDSTGPGLHEKRSLRGQQLIEDHSVSADFSAPLTPRD